MGTSLFRGQRTGSGPQPDAGNSHRPAWWRVVIVVGCLTATRSAAVEIEVGYAVAQPGDEVSVDVVLYTNGTRVAGIQNDIGFDRAAAIIATTDGTPDCQVNAAINKAATNFAFQPPGCLERDACTAVRALVLAFDNLDPIADGAVLYNCRVAIGADEPAAPHFLACSHAAAADPAGHRLATTCRNGETLLPGGTPRPTPTQTPRAIPTPTLAPRTVEISIGYTVAQPGEEVAVDVVLHSGDVDVAGIQNDILFEPDAPIAARADGRPDCFVNPAIDKPGTSFAFQPPACDPGRSCSAVRALVLALDNVDPIADGAVLYSCRVVVDGEEPAAPHFLACANEGAADPSGKALVTTCRSGEILLPGGSPRPTPTYTPTVTYTPTATPTATWTPWPAQADYTATATRGSMNPTPESRSTRTLLRPPTPGTSLPDGSAATSSDSGGCSADGGSRGGWLLLAPLLLMVGRRVSRSLV